MLHSSLKPHLLNPPSLPSRFLMPSKKLCVRDGVMMCIACDRPVRDTPAGAGLSVCSALSPPRICGWSPWRPQHAPGPSRPGAARCVAASLSAPPGALWCPRSCGHSATMSPSAEDTARDKSDQEHCGVSAVIFHSCLTNEECAPSCIPPEGPLHSINLQSSAIMSN